MLIREKYVSLHPLKQNIGRVAQLNRVADYGSAGYRFESCRDHRVLHNIIVEDFFLKQGYLIRLKSLLITLKESIHEKLLSLSWMLNIELGL